MFHKTDKNTGNWAHLLQEAAIQNQTETPSLKLWLCVIHDQARRENVLFKYILPPALTQMQFFSEPFCTERADTHAHVHTDFLRKIGFTSRKTETGKFYIFQPRIKYSISKFGLEGFSKHIHIAALMVRSVSNKDLLQTAQKNCV